MHTSHNNSKRVACTLFALVTVLLVAAQTSTFTLSAPHKAGSKCEFTFAERRQVVQLDAQGKLQLPITPLMEYCNVFIDNKTHFQLYLGNGSLDVTLSPDGTLSFKGKTATINHHYSTQKIPYLVFRKFNLPVSEFEQEIARFKAEHYNKIDSLYGNYKTFAGREKQKIDYQIKMSRLIRLSQNEADRTDANFARLMRETPIDPTLFSLKPYTGYIYCLYREYCHYLHPEAVYPHHQTRHLLTFLEEKCPNKALLEVLIFQAAFEYMFEQGNDSYLDAAIKKHVSDPYLLKEFERKRTKWEKLYVEKPFFDIGFTAPDGKPFDVSQFKGKYVLIDMWATWCGPCILEQRKMFAYEKELEGLPIAFVTFSVDNDRDKWLKYLTNNKMTGNTHFNYNNYNKFAKLYATRGIPRFTLLDKEGNLLWTSFHRPTRELQFKETLKKILKQQ